MKLTLLTVVVKKLTKAEAPQLVEVSSHCRHLHLLSDKFSAALN